MQAGGGRLAEDMGDGSPSGGVSVECLAAEPSRTETRSEVGRTGQGRPERGNYENGAQKQYDIWPVREPVGPWEGKVDKVGHQAWDWTRGPPGLA